MTTETNRTTRGKLIRRYPLVSFFVLSYVFFAIAILLLGAVFSMTAVSTFAMGLLIALASWTPNAAAVLVTGATEGRAGIRRLFAGWARWRVSFWWYVFALAPIGVALVAAVFYTAVGGTNAARATTDLTVSSISLMVLFHTIQGATGEELGWRGFALPALQRRFSSLVSALILGVLISGWHGLLHIVSPTGVPEWQFVVLLMSYSVIVTWAYNKSRGSVLISTIFHFSFNFSLELFTSSLNMIPLERLFMIRTIVYTIVALLLIAISGKNLGRKSSGVGAGNRIASP